MKKNCVIILTLVLVCLQSLNATRLHRLGSNLEIVAKSLDLKVPENRRLHPGHNDPLSDDTKVKWEAAFKAEEVHLASQIKFHTSELSRYESRDKQYAAERAAWTGEGDLMTRFKATLDANRKYKTSERTLDKTINKNKKARGTPRDQARDALKDALNFRRLDIAVRRSQENSEDSVNSAFEKYITTAEAANDSEQAFHTVEFKEFSGRQKCVDDARVHVAEATATPSSMKDLYTGCLKKVQKDVKEAEVNVANDKRKVDRKDVPKLWGAFAKAGHDCIRSQMQNRKKPSRKLDQGHNDQLTDEQKTKWETAFKTEEAHLASQRKFHTSELLRYENRDKQYAAEKSAWNGEGDETTRFKNTLDVNRKYREIERGLNKTINANQRARKPF